MIDKQSELTRLVRLRDQVQNLLRDEDEWNVGPLPGLLKDDRAAIHQRLHDMVSDLAEEITFYIEALEVGVLTSSAIAQRFLPSLEEQVADTVEMLGVAGAPSSRGEREGR